jgi:hypothetical protein
MCRGVSRNPHGYTSRSERWYRTGTMKTMAIEVSVVTTLLKVNGVTAETAPAKIREILRAASYSESDIDEAVLMVGRWGSTQTPPLSASGSPPSPGVPYPSPLPLPPLESTFGTKGSKKGVSNVVLIFGILAVLLAVSLIGMVFYITVYNPGSGEAVNVSMPTLTF